MKQLKLFPMEKFNRKSLILLFTTCLVFCFWSLPAESAGLIGVDFEDDPLFEIDNFYPGMSVSKDVTVENKDLVERDLYVTMDGMDNDNFADQINFYVIKKSSGKFFVGGSGDKMTLKDMNDDGNAFIERMTVGDSTDYEIRVKLKTSTGNEFQNEEIESFEVGLAFSDLPNPPTPPYRSGQLPGGNEEGEVEGVQSEESNQNQEPGGPLESGAVFGEQDKCQSRPLWAWITALAVYAILFLWSLFNNFKDHVKEKKIRWGWPLILIIAAFLFWYNFDKCQKYDWFIISVAVGSVIIYLYYLRLLKKEMIRN